MSKTLCFWGVSQLTVHLIAKRRWSYFAFLKLNIKLQWLGNLIRGRAKTIGLEKLTYVVKGKYNTFVKIWRSFMEFLEGDDFIVTL